MLRGAVIAKMWLQKPSNTYPSTQKKKKTAFLEKTQSQSSAKIPAKSMRVFLLEGEGPRCDALKSLQPGLDLKAGS